LLPKSTPHVANALQVRWPLLEPLTDENFMTAFKELGLNGRLVRNIEAKGYKTPTPVQESAIPLVLSGNDVMASAQTWNGQNRGFYTAHSASAERQ
jgi:superfamily II DNA/RNA helicase